MRLASIQPEDGHVPHASLGSELDSRVRTPEGSCVVGYAPSSWGHGRPSSVTLSCVLCQ